jgi:hypothetical protein
MIPIWRFPSKLIEVSRGEFDCPECRQFRPYIHKERVKRRLVVFVPIMGETIEEYIECQTCRKRFPLTALRTKLSESAEQIIERLRGNLADGQPIEEAESALHDAGMPIGQVKQYMSVAAGIGRKRCPECQLTYRKNVLNCRKCSHRLPDAQSLAQMG